MADQGQDDGMSDAVRSILAAPSLGEFEGSDVLGVGIEIPNAGGGLHESMSVDPVVLHKDDECYVLLRCRMRYPKFPPIKDTDCVRRVQVLHAEEGMFVDAEFAKSNLDEMRERVRLAKEQAAGIQRLSIDGDGDEADAAEVLVTQHRQGVHDDEPRDGCPMCVEAQTDADSNGEGGAEPTQIDGARKARGRARKATE